MELAAGTEGSRGVMDVGEPGLDPARKSCRFSVMSTSAQGAGGEAFLQGAKLNVATAEAGASPELIFLGQEERSSQSLNAELRGGTSQFFFKLISVEFSSLPTGKSPDGGRDTSPSISH